LLWYRTGSLVPAVTAAFGDAVPVLKPVSAWQVGMRVNSLRRSWLLRCCGQTSQQESRHDSTKLAHDSSSKDRYRELSVTEAGEGVIEKKHAFNNTATLDFMEKQNNCSCEPLLFSSQERKIAAHSTVPSPYIASADG
jgi:hypothetical protein